jgi:alpha-beta hydrolase superfamily lysophospholipase
MIAVTLLLLCATLLGLVASVAWLGADRLLTLPRPTQRPAPLNLGWPVEDVSFLASDGVLLRGWFFPRPGAPVIIYCPGRGHGLDDFDFRFADVFCTGGYQVLMFDWRGMGASDGQSSMGYWEQQDLRAAVAFVRQRAGDAKIGVFGISLGAAVVFLAAGSIPAIAAAAGECAFATYQGMIASGGRHLYRAPALAARPMSWLVARLAAWRRSVPLHAADPVRQIGRISPRPVFIVHGMNDHHIPVADGYALFAAAGEPKLLWTPDVAHTATLDELGDEYRRRLLSFFDAWLR